MVQTVRRICHGTVQWPENEKSGTGNSQGFRTSGVAVPGRYTRTDPHSYLATASLKVSSDYWS